MESRTMRMGRTLDLPDSNGERVHVNNSYEVSAHDEKVSLIDHEQTGALGLIPSPASGARKATNRSLSGMKSFCSDVADLEDGKVVKDRERSAHMHVLGKVHNQALLSGIAYCISSCSMILVNKFVLSSYDFSAGIFLMVYQNLVSVIIVSLLSFSGIILTEPLTWRLIKVWLPVNVIFVGMLITSIFSLKYINVAMVTILKNVTNVITALGEMYLFNKHHDNKVWAALFFMIISAISGGITDLTFHAVGYSWQFLNCLLTASYSLTLRKIMDTAKQVSKSGNLNEFSMVLLNNVLSLPLGLMLLVAFNEVDYLSNTFLTKFSFRFLLVVFFHNLFPYFCFLYPFCIIITVDHAERLASEFFGMWAFTLGVLVYTSQWPLLRMPAFWLVLTASGLLGLAISFTSMWFLHQTGATTYSLVGSLNKIPLSIAGILLFNVPTTPENFSSIIFGLLAGVVFAKAKMMERT